MDKQEDEKDNVTRVGLAVRDEIQDAMRRVIDSNIPSSLENIFNTHKHRIYHHFSTKCHFKCDYNSSIYKKKTILKIPQMEIVYNRSIVHKENSLSFCCSTAIPGITTKIFDVTFSNAFLNMFPELIYWPSCLQNQNMSLQDLLNINKHKLYHLYTKKPCCHCLKANQLSTDDNKLKKRQFEVLFDKQASVSCKNTGTLGECICTFSANNLKEESLDDWLTYVVLLSCCALKKCIDAMVEVRNKVYGHACDSKMPNKDYKDIWKLIEENIPELLNHGIFDKKEREEAIQEFTQRLDDLKGKRLTAELYRQVVTNLLQQNVDMEELSEKMQAGFENLQSVAENTESGVWHLQSLSDGMERLENSMTELTRLVVDQKTNPDLDTDTVPEYEPGSQDRYTSSDIDNDAEPYLPEDEPQSQGAEATDRRDERSADSKEQTYLKTGATGSEQTFRKDGYKYDTLVLHSEDDEEHVNEMIKMMEEKVDLPDVKIVSVGNDMVAGTSLFKSFFKLLKDSCTVLLFVTPSFYTDCWSDHRLETVLADRMKGSPCVIPVLYGETKLRDELKLLGNIKSIIFFKEKDGDEYKSFIMKITKALQHYRDKGNK